MSMELWVTAKVGAALGRQLCQRGWLMGTAESCTGGGVAAALTALPGASAWFAGGLVSYSNAWKQRCLGVKAGTLRQHGAVSAATVMEMLKGLCRRQRVQAGLAVSGIAGPDGGTAEKPVGTVYISVGAGIECRVYRALFNGNREEIRQQAAAVAAAALLALLDGSDYALPECVREVDCSDVNATP